jgi:hypothetical protein
MTGRSRPDRDKPVVSNDRIARLWRDMAEGKREDAALRFSQAIDHILDEGKFTMGRMRSIVDRLHPADALPFMAVVDGVASVARVMIESEEGEEEWELEVFGIPVSGELASISDLEKNPEKLAAIAAAVRETGWSMERSLVKLHPQMIGPAAFAHMEAPMLRQLARESLACMIDGATGAPVMAELGKAFSGSQPHEEALHFGVRFLVGHRFVSAEGADPDGLSPEVERDAGMRRITASYAAWHDRMNEIFKDDPRILVDAPVMWPKMHAAVMLVTFDQALGLALAKDGDAPEAIDASGLRTIMTQGKDELRIEVRRGRETILDYAMSNAIVGRALEDFFHGVAKRMPAEFADPEEGMGPALSPT